MKKEIVLTKKSFMMIVANIFIAYLVPGMYVSCLIGTLLLPYLTKKYKHFWQAKGYFVAGIVFSICTGFVFPIVLYLNWIYIVKPMTTDVQKEEKKEDESGENPSFEQLKMNYVSQIIQRKILEANAKGCDFFEIDQAGKLSGYKNGKMDLLYDTSVNLKMKAASYPEICKWFKENIPELTADYTEKKLIISWI